jgi:hypothetical protein
LAPMDILIFTPRPMATYRPQIATTICGGSARSAPCAQPG